MENVFVTRQPIYDRTHNVFGYELLYSGTENAKNNSIDELISTARTILSTFLDYGLDRMVGSGQAFIDIPLEFLYNDTLLPMFEGQSVLEISVNTTQPQVTLENMTKLRDKGYYLALDNFEFNEEQYAILDYFDYVKIDVGAHSVDTLMANIDRLKTKNNKIIAINVETHTMSEVCAKMGFDYFEGNFYSQPQTVKSDILSSNNTNLLTLIQKLLEPKSSIDEIAEILSRDVPLTYKLLRYINSASFSNRTEIESIHDALILIGVDAVRNWASMILMSDMSSTKPTSIFTTALTRAKMCEALSDKLNMGISSQMFITGLFSLLDVILDMSMPDALDELSLIIPIRLALQNHEGQHGLLLKQVILYEKGAWEELVNYKVDSELFTRLYLESVNWAFDTYNEMQH